ncbi:lipopolysaccharide biosynthesis protein [Terrimonas pollutisoli]|uniref:lipopolysaccharide biosynthesis protein n=1 Tax=Terrimonas pollutisoli TaxID=3034147 RepID=UPI0023ED1FB9|nr:oligosaccharide flippase family protein [Terrimonas sp. H1YJ31]
MKLAKQFSVYTLVGFLNAGIGFLILPVLTHYLSPADYGVISLMNTYVQILMPVVGLSTASFISVEYFNKKLEAHQFKEIFSSVRAIPLLLLLPFLLLFIAGYKFLPSLMELPILAYWLLLPLTLFVLYTDNFKSFLVISKRMTLFTVTTLGKILIEIPLTLLLLIYVHLQWDGRIYAWLFTVVIFSLLSVYYYRKWNLLEFIVKREYVKQAIVFGAPLILHQIGKFVINQSDRLFLTKMISVEEMGIYSVGYQVGMVILILVTAFSNFFSPFLYERLNRNTEQDKIEIVRVSYLFIIGMFLTLTILTILTPGFFAYFISEKFSKASIYVFWIGLSYCFWGIYIVFTGYIFYLKKSKVLGRLAILNVAVNLSSNYFFIKWFGTVGAAYATCLSFALVCIIIVVIAQKLYPMPWLAFRRLLNFKKEN